MRRVVSSRYGRKRRRNPAAKSLEDPKHRHRVVPHGAKYTRKGKEKFFFEENDERDKTKRS